MNIAIVGAGIIGVTTAYELAADGHDVTVLEQHGAAAEEASFAHAGRISTADMMPWTTRVKLGWPLSASDLAWLWTRHRAQRRALTHTSLLPLAAYSRDRLHQITADLQLEYERSDGSLTLLRSDKDQALAQPGLQLLREAGQTFREISADEARQIEPALHPHTPLAGAVHWPNDEVGNCRLFAVLLKQAAKSLGAQFEFHRRVARIDPAATSTLGIEGEDAPRRFDAVVLCTGIGSGPLLEPLGVKLPLLALHGYSVSAPVREPLNAPRSTVLDAHHQVSISRLGQRVRVSGGADLGGPAKAHRGHSVRTLYQVLSDWFPGAAHLSSGVQVWKGARPMMPDGLPLLGASGAPGLWLNMGHGSSGWALACGSARAMADLIGGRSPDVDLAALGLSRLPR